MFLNNLNERERLIALSTALMAVAALLYSFIIEPVGTHWSFLNNEISSRQNVLSKDQRLSMMHERIAAEYANFSKNVNPAQGLDNGVADTMNLIEYVSRKNACTIVNMKPLSDKNSLSYKEIMIEVTAEASMDVFSKFIYDIESSNSVMIRINRVTLTPKPGQTGVLRGVLIITKIIVV